MKRQYHILNGDSLKEQFPAQIDGEVIVARECFVDGEVESDSLEELFRVRAKFIAGYYDDYSIADYYTDSVSEFEKIKKIPKASDINLWFEDDLFCQVNLWFTANLIFDFVNDCNVFLVRPNTHTQYGFGGLDESEIITAFKEKTPILELDKIASLWNFYQKNDTEKLALKANEMETNFPFIPEAVEAHIGRIPNENSLGRPMQALIRIMEDLDTDAFEPVFREFNKRESIYGFGDLQVKRLLEEIKSNR